MKIRLLSKTVDFHKNDPSLGPFWAVRFRFGNLCQYLKPDHDESSSKIGKNLH